MPTDELSAKVVRRIYRTLAGNSGDSRLMAIPPFSMNILIYKTPDCFPDFVKD